MIDDNGKERQEQNAPGSIKEQALQKT